MKRIHKGGAGRTNRPAAVDASAAPASQANRDFDVEEASETAAQRRRVGLKGFEPLTLRLSSACSNQLSYRPGGGAERAEEVNSDR